MKLIKERLNGFASALHRRMSGLTAVALGTMAPTIALAQDAPTPDKGDVSWMLVSTLLVVLMTVPGLALFYGGLVRSKNILSVLMQVMVGFSVIVVLWCLYGYSLAFTEGNALIGGSARLFLNGVWDPAAGTFAYAATFSKGVVIPEIIFVAFQATFAGITCALIVGAFAERPEFVPNAASEERVQGAIFGERLFQFRFVEGSVLATIHHGKHAFSEGFARYWQPAEMHTCGGCQHPGEATVDLSSLSKLFQSDSHQ